MTPPLPSLRAVPLRAILLLASLLLLPGGAAAHDDEELPPLHPWEEAPVTARSRAWARVEQFTWREYDGDRRLLEETGQRYRVGVNRAFEREGLAFTPSVELMYGSVDYDGHTQDGTPATTDVDYRGYTLAVEGGKIVRFSSGAALEPHLGVGWESWRRDINSSGFAIGYVEKWDSFVARGGFRGELPLGGRASRVRLLADGGVEWPFAANNAVNFPGVAGEVTVHPKGLPWPYGEAGIAVDPFRVTLAYRGVRFDPSNPVDIGGGLALMQPESQADIWSLELSGSF